MSETLRRATLATVVAVSLVAVVAVALHTGSGPAQANHNVEVGVDVDTSGNTDTSLGTIDNCRIVSYGQTFDIDIYIMRVSSLISSEVWFQYDPTKLEIQSYQLPFQNGQAGSSVTDGSESLPDIFEPGQFRISAVETAQSSGDTGTGPLVRLNMKAIGTGLSTANISKIDVSQPPDGTPDRGVTLKDSGNNAIGDTDGDSLFDGAVTSAGVFVGTGSDCSTDSDSDGVPDATDNCPSIPNFNQNDWNSDGTGDACQDSDADGLMDDVDNCPGASNVDQADQDGDSIGDACDPDIDGDGVDNATDNCPSISNPPPQTDTDGDGLGDACDDDMDGDTYTNDDEAFIGTDPLDDCADDLADDAFPPDINNDTNVNILDVGAMRDPFLSQQGDPNYSTRVDLNADTVINVLDIGEFRSYFMTNCTGV